MRWMATILAVCAGAQTPQPGESELNQAYAELRAKRYDQAIALFRKGLALRPGSAAVRKDLAYTLLKTGETEAARDQFGDAMRLDPGDIHVALEYAFLCHETRRTAEARSVFARVRSAAKADAKARETAERALGSIDGELTEGIARWQGVVAQSPDNFSAHEELARLAEQRGENGLAAKHYRRAWSLRPGKRSLLIDFARVEQGESARVALLAASRSADSRSAETALDLLGDRYPYVSEFRAALALEPRNLLLRRELGFLLLALNNPAAAETEFHTVVELDPGDLTAGAQLGFLRLARGDRESAIPLLERALGSPDEALRGRVREVLGAVPGKHGTPKRNSAARTMADKSYAAGFLNDALRQYAAAYEDDPADFEVMLRMGWTLNMLKRDGEALGWFDKARRSPDQRIAEDAARAFRNLRPALARVRTSTWMMPFYSSRWRNGFSYGQVKTEFRIGKLPLRPYLSSRFTGDTLRGRRFPQSGAQPQFLSENAVVLGGGIATNYWKGLVGWAEAGRSLGYLDGKTLPDYRGGIAFGKGFGRFLGGESNGAFFSTNADLVYVSRFDNAVLLYSQNRAGYTVNRGLRLQVYWNANWTGSTRREYWANYVETGPGFRFRTANMPQNLLFSVDYLAGFHTQTAGNPGGRRYFDLRAGLWYAFTH